MSCLSFGRPRLSNSNTTANTVHTVHSRRVAPGDSPARASATGPVPRGGRWRDPTQRGNRTVKGISVHTAEGRRWRQPPTKVDPRVSSDRAPLCLPYLVHLTSRCSLGALDFTPHDAPSVASAIAIVPVPMPSPQCHVSQQSRRALGSHVEQSNAIRMLMLLHASNAALDKGVCTYLYLHTHAKHRLGDLLCGCCVTPALADQPRH